MDTVARVALDRLALLGAPTGPTDPHRVTAALVELSRVGVRVTNPQLFTDAAAATVPGAVAHVRQARGQRGTYSPLFAGFPDKLPAFDDVYLRALLGAMRLPLEGEPDDSQVRAAYDFTDFGWWPASSVRQDVDQAHLDRARQDVLPPDGHTQWQTLTLADPGEVTDAVRTWMADAFYAPTSLRQDVRDDLAELIGVLGVDHIDPAEVRFRETRTLLARTLWDTERDRIPAAGLTPDDLLRLLADLTGSDVSLATPMRYPKLTRADRRIIVSALEASDRLTDVFRRRGMWLALGKGLHVGEHTYAPRTREVFTRLRATRHDHSSVPSQFEAALAIDLPAAVKLACEQSPGLLGRQVRRLAHLAAGDPVALDSLLDAIADAAPRISLRVLLAARNQVADNGATYPRVAILKNGSALPILHAPGHLAVAADVRTRLLEALDETIHDQLAAKGCWVGQSIYLAPGLDRVLVPEALRTTSAGLIQVERGSIVPSELTAVLRLFVHWKDPGSDLDLSCLALGADFEVVSQVSWTNLRDGAMVHSGDITSAPVGAQEFIDIDIAKARAQGATRGWRYLAPAIFRYSGPAFGALEEANAGWMLRTQVSADRVTFDPATVAGAFALTGGRRTAVPFVLDLLTGDIVYVDLYLGGAPGASTETQADSIGFLARALVARHTLKTDVEALVRAHVTARGGELVTRPEDATITVGYDPGSTYDVLRPEKLLADLL